MKNPKSIKSLMSKFAPQVLSGRGGLGATELLNELRPIVAKEQNKQAKDVNMGSMWGCFQGAIAENPNVEHGADGKYYWKKSSVGQPRGAGKVARKRQSSHSPAQKSTGKKERDYEEPFCKYLKEVLKECTKAKPYGTERGGGTKWSNPDVFGIAEYTRLSRHAKFFDEIVSVEIKKTEDEGEILKGFGQACAYFLFSHKVYLVICVPPDKKQTKNKKEFLDRLKAMCHLVGLGLVFFTEQKKPTNSTFKLKLSARKQHPDINYLNQMIENADALLYG